MEDPCLGVQARRAGVVRDLDVDPKVGHLVESTSLRGTEVRRRDESHGYPALAKRLERTPQQPDTCPANERHDDVDSVGGAKFAVEHLPEARLVRCVDQEVRHRKRQQRRGKTLLVR
jgi:hypothetical protein